MLLALIHLIVSTVLAGMLIVAAMLLPNHFELGLKTIGLAAALGFALAFPVAFGVARAIRQSSAKPAP